MRTDTEDLISVTDASKRGVSNLVATASEGRRLVVLRNNEPAAVIADVTTMERLQRIEDVEEDLRLLSIALVRTVTDSGSRHDLDDVATELGVDLDDSVED